jgi:hypothetical protein
MLEGVLTDKAIEVLFQLTCDFGRSTGAWAIHQARDTLVGKAVDPFAEGGIVKCNVSETDWSRCLVTTARTAWARRNVQASFVFFKKVSRVGRASSGKCSLRVRMQVVSTRNCYKNRTIPRHTTCLPSLSAPSLSISNFPEAAIRSKSYIHGSRSRVIRKREATRDWGAQGMHRAPREQILPWKEDKYATGS